MNNLELKSTRKQPNVAYDRNDTCIIFRAKFTLFTSLLHTSEAIHCRHLREVEKRHRLIAHQREETAHLIYSEAKGNFATHSDFSVNIKDKIDRLNVLRDNPTLMGYMLDTFRETAPDM